MDENFKVEGHSVDEMIGRILKATEKRGPLSHLVLNAHGKMFGNNAIVHLGRGIGHADIHKFAALNGKVRYIWLQNCAVGADHKLMASMAQHTQAWVTAYQFSIAVLRVPRHHIDHQLRAFPRHWFGPNCDVAANKTDSEPRSKFFREARHRQDPNLKHALHFNIIRQL